MQGLTARALALGSILVIASGCATSPPTASTGSSTTPPSVAAATIPTADGEIPAGTYQVPASDWSAVGYTVTVPEDWSAQYGQLFLKHAGTAEEFGISAAAVDDIHLDSCVGGVGGVMEVGPDAEDIGTALLEQVGPDVSASVTAEIDGYTGYRTDLRVPDGFDLEPCNVAGIGLDVWYVPSTDKHFVLLKDNVASVYAIDVSGKRQVFLTMHPVTTSAEDLEELEQVLGSIRLLP